MSLSTIVYPVRDLAGAKAVFTAFLGTPPATDTPYYVGFTVDGQEIGLDPHGEQLVTRMVGTRGDCPRSEGPGESPGIGKPLTWARFAVG